MLRKYERYFPNNMPPLPPDGKVDKTVFQQISSYMQHTLTSIAVNFPPTSTASWDVYTGLTGVAYMHYYIFIKTGKKIHLDSAIEYLEPSLLLLESKPSSKVSFLCGVAGPYALGALIYHAQGAMNKVLLFGEKLVALQKLKCNSDEHLYGWSGYLFALLLVKRNIPEINIPDQLVDDICSRILDSGKKFKNKPANCPLMYNWPTMKPKCYLGAAHGISGILYTLLCVPDFATRNYIPIQETLSYLEKIMFPSGNWGWTLGVSNDSDLAVQWCHGAPGFAFLWCKAYQVFKDEKYLKLAKIAAETTWQQGLLKKGRGLCHGIIGNGYVFIELYKITGDDCYWHQALMFMEFCWSCTEKMGTPDTPWSLFEGVAGIPLYCLDVMEPLKSWGFPGFCV